MLKIKLISILLFFPLNIVAQTVDTTIIPNSIYFNKYSVFAEGNNSKLFVWAEPMLEDLRKTLETFPRVNCVEFYFLVLNKSNKQVNLRPSNLSITFRDNNNDDVFIGERWTDLKTGKPGDYVNLGPSITEINGEDVSLYELDSVNLRKDDFALLQASFVVGKEDTYESFITRIKGFTIKVEPIKEKSFNLFINVLQNK